MDNPSHHAIEAIAFVLFGLCLWHAVRIGRGNDNRYAPTWAPLAAMVGTLLFTFGVEAALGGDLLKGLLEGRVEGDTLSIYEYPDVYLLQADWLLGVPLWIPIGWSFVVYVAMRTSDKLEADWRFRPVVDGLLALNLDLTLDPIAAHNGWWTWTSVQYHLFNRQHLEEAAEVSGEECLRELNLNVLLPDKNVYVPDGAIGEPPSLSQFEWIPSDLVTFHCRPGFEPGHTDYFGIPLLNFFAWFFIVAGFSLGFRCLRRMFHRRDHRGFGWELAAALAALVPAAVILAVYVVLSRVAPRLGVAGAILFSVIWGIAMLWVLTRWFTYSTGHRFDRMLWLSPLALHLFLFYEIFVRKGFVAMPELTVFVPTVATVGLFLFGWPYLEDMQATVRKHGWWRLFIPFAGIEHTRTQADTPPVEAP